MIILSLKNILINENNKNLTHINWNKLVDFNISLDNILQNIIGPSYKGQYDPSIEYDKYDYIWIDNKLVIIDDLINQAYKEFNINESFSRAVYSNEFLYYINKNGNIKRTINNSSITFDSITVDDYKINYKGEIVARKGTRFYKIINNNVIPINITFGSEIIDYTIDKNYIYFISEGIIRFGNIYNSDNTYFQELEIDLYPSKISVSNNFIFILDHIGDILIIDKSNYEFKKYQLDLNINNENLNIIAINDNYIVIYNGLDELRYYYILNNSIKLINIKNIKNNSLILNAFNSEYITVTSGRNINVVRNVPFNYREIDISKVLSCDNLIKINEYLYSIDFSKGQISYPGINLKSNLNTTMIENKYLSLNNGSIKYDNFSSLLNKTLILDININNSFNGTYIGYLKTNNKQIFFNNESVKGDLKIIINILENTNEIFIYKDNKFIKNITKINSNINELNELLISGNGVNLKKLIITSINNKEINDFYGKNEIYTDDYSINISNPYSYAKTDSKGNLNIQQGTNNTKGIVYLSDNFELNDKNTAISTVGSKKINDKIINIEEKLIPELASKEHKHRFNEILDIPHGNYNTKGIVYLSDNFELNDKNTAISTVGSKKINDKIINIEEKLIPELASKEHKHRFNEILDIPHGNYNTKGIVYLSNKIEDDSSKAANSSDLKKTYDLANHTHPYLNYNNGGKVNGDTTFSKNLISSGNFIYYSASGEQLQAKIINVDSFNSKNSIFSGNSTFNGISIFNNEVTFNKAIKCKSSITSGSLTTTNLYSSNTITTRNFETNIGSFSTLISKSITSDRVSSKTVSASSNMTSNQSDFKNSNIENLNITNKITLNGYSITIG